jgi:acyl-CoA synthetase (AMP-forming)/AMP-acid ligase II
VCRVANVLRAWGVKRGDTVALYMPMIPELGASGCGCMIKKFYASLQLAAWALPLSAQCVAPVCCCSVLTNGV